MRGDSRSKRDFDRHLVILSDTEMGAGGATDDCPHSGAVAAHLERVSLAHPNTPVTFVFNGDTFDFLKTPVDGAYPRYVTEATALEKLERVRAAHPAFFATLRRILSGPDREAVFVVGNHDFELFFGAVQDRLRALLGPNVVFPGMQYSVGDVLVEHGSQGDPLFRVDPDAPFLEHEGQEVLRLPWGAVGVIDAVLPYHPELHVLDRIRPKEALFELMPEAKELLVQVARRYWLGTYWHDLLVEQDPLKRVGWDILKEVAYRLVFTDPSVTFGEHYLAALADDPDHRVYVVGHEHVAREISRDDRTLLVTSCLRTEYALDPRTGSATPCRPKIAEVPIVGGRATDARLVGVELPVRELPDVRALAPAVRRCLDALEPAPDVLPLLSFAAARLRARRGVERSA